MENISLDEIDVTTRDFFCNLQYLGEQDVFYIFLLPAPDFFLKLFDEISSVPALTLVEYH